MREIKFRGYNGEKWLFGNLDIDYKAKHACISDNRFWRHPVRFDTVGQFTGLLDVDGREIYEGDVIASSFADYKAVVEFRNGAFVAVTGPVDTYQALYGVLRLKGLRVIGNVHDNPDLLEAAHD